MAHLSIVSLSCNLRGRWSQDDTESYGEAESCKRKGGLPFGAFDSSHVACKADRKETTPKAKTKQKTAKNKAGFHSAPSAHLAY